MRGPPGNSVSTTGDSASMRHFRSGTVENALRNLRENSSPSDIVERGIVGDIVSAPGDTILNSRGKTSLGQLPVSLGRPKYGPLKGC